MKDGRARGKCEGNVARMNRWEVEVNRTTHKRTMDGTYMSIGHGFRFKERRPGDDDPAAADHQLLIVRVAAVVVTALSLGQQTSCAVGILNPSPVRAGCNSDLAIYIFKRDSPAALMP